MFVLFPSFSETIESMELKVLRKTSLRVLICLGRKKSDIDGRKTEINGYDTSAMLIYLSHVTLLPRIVGVIFGDSLWAGRCQSYTERG